MKAPRFCIWQQYQVEDNITIFSHKREITHSYNSVHLFYCALQCDDNFILNILFNLKLQSLKSTDYRIHHL